MKHILLSISFIVLFWTHLYAQTIYTIGPTIHICFGKSSVIYNYGVEGAVWNSKGLGIDAGFEFYKTGFRFYTEIEAVMGFMGASIGPVIEFPLKEDIRLGFQESLWINYYLGVDYKRRTF